MYVLVPGLFTEHHPGYMNENEQRLKDLGLSTRRAPIDTDASVAANAKVVRDTVLQAAKDGKQVVLLGHSKGGVDAAAAMSLYPELKDHVRGVIAMQAPYGGTPVAQDIETCEKLAPVANSLITSLFKGDPKSLADLSYDSRERFLSDHPYPSEVPTLSLASASSSLLSLTAKSAGYMKLRYGIDSDGLVPKADAQIPGARVVLMDGLDHAPPCMSGPAPARNSPGDLTEGLVRLLFQQPDARASA